MITYTLAVLVTLLFLWDREWRVFGTSILFTDLALRPREFLGVVSGQSVLNAAQVLSTPFTAMFLHADLMHLIGNLIFLLTFGRNVEYALGGVRFALYYLFWGLMAWAAHIYVMADSPIPTLGASGAIGGVLGAYFLLFPGNRIKFIVFPLVFLPFVIPAWVMLGLWFLWQIFFPQAGVANWAHAGGFMAGMLTVLVMGGRDKVLVNKRLERDDDPDFS